MGKFTNKEEKFHTGKHHSDIRSHRLFTIIIVFIPFLLYGASLFNKYSIDDYLVISKNPVFTKGTSGLGDIFTTHYSNYTDDSDGKNYRYDYRPVVLLTFAIEHIIFGENPFTGHLINLLLYALLLYLLFRLLLKIFHNQEALLPFLIVLLYAAHPVHTEVICSLKNRDEIISLIFSLLSTTMILTAFNSKKLLLVLPAVFLFILALLSKFDALVFAAVIPLFIFFFTTEKIWKPVLIFLLFLSIVIAFRYIVQLFLPDQERFVYYFENPFRFEKNIFIRLGTGLYTLLIYLKLLILPHPLGYYYGYNQIPLTGFGNIWVILSLLIHIAFLGIALFHLRRKKLLSFVIILYLISISAFANIVKPVLGILGERYLLFPSLAFCIALVFLLYFISGRSIFKAGVKQKTKKTLLVLSIIILSLYSIKTITRNFAWKNSDTLLAVDADYLDKSFKAQFLYSTSLLQQAEKNQNPLEKEKLFKASYKRLKQSLLIFSELPAAWNNYGRIHQNYFHNADSARFCYEKAISIDSSFFVAYYNLADLYDILGKSQMAISTFKKALMIKSENIYPHYRLMTLYFATNEAKLAFLYGDLCRLRFPESAIPDEITGNYFYNKGDTIHAIEFYKLTLVKSPKNSRVQNLLNLLQK